MSCRVEQGGDVAGRQYKGWANTPCTLTRGWGAGPYAGTPWWKVEGRINSTNDFLDREGLVAAFVMGLRRGQNSLGKRVCGLGLSMLWW